MSYGDHRLYIYDDPIDLVVTSDALYLENRPMNNRQLKAHKGFSNELTFNIRDRDRKLQNVFSETIYAHIYNPQTKKRLLTRNNATYKEINIATVDGAMDEMIKKANGKRTIPQIFFDDQHIGGYDEVRALEKENKLQDLLK